MEGVGDLIFPLVVAAFFAATVLLVRACSLVVGAGPSVERDG
jgi:hypothetical protein